MRSLFLPLLLGLAMLVGAPRADAMPPLLDDLLNEYKALGLPLPPNEAKLVRYESGGRTIINGVAQPPSYSLAFLTPPKPPMEQPRLLLGYLDFEPQWEVVYQEIAPEKASADDLYDGGDDALAMAMQSHARGWTKLATALLQRSINTETEEPLQTRLVHMAWHYWEGQLTEPKIDRKPIAKRLKELMLRDKSLGTKGNRILLRDLELALAPSTAKPGSVDALIDALVDYNKQTGPILVYKPGEEYLALVKLGFDAVPALIAHLNDTRLTRVQIFGFNNSPQWYMRVQHIVCDILEGIAGRSFRDEESLDDRAGNRVIKARVVKWWTNARQIGEEKYLFRHVLPDQKEFDDSQEVHEWILLTIAEKYPTRLVGIYQEMLDNRPFLDSGAIAEAIATARIPIAEKRDAFLYGAKHKKMTHRLAALWALKDIDAKQFNAILLQLIEGLPKDIDETYWSSAEASIPSMILESSEPKIWVALEAAAKRATPGFRMTLLNNLGYPTEVRRRGERLRLLVAFLDDDAFRGNESVDRRFGAPAAGFPYAAISVRNFAALELAGMLKIEVPFDDKRAEADWAKIRDQVRTTALRAIEKP